MIGLIAGIAFMAISLLYMGLKLQVAYWLGAEPESGGGVPTLDAILFPSAIFAWGLWFAANGGDETRLSVWVGLGVWVVAMLLAVIGMNAATAIGRQRRRRKG